MRAKASTPAKNNTIFQQFKNIFFAVNAIFKSKYFLIPLFGLDFALRGGTEALIPLLAQMGFTPAYPLLVELGFALLVGVGIYFTYKATMDYVVSPLLSFCGQWFSDNIYQPCCHFANKFRYNEVAADASAESSEEAPDSCCFEPTNKDFFEKASPVFLPSNTLTPVTATVIPVDSNIEDVPLLLPKSGK